MQGKERGGSSLAVTGGPVSLHHWTYGVTPGEGYGIKAYSVGLNISLFDTALRGRYTPIRGDAVQSEGGVNSRMVHPASSGEDVLLSRLGKGPPDELGRPTFQNHLAVIPRELLVQKRVSLSGVDEVMGSFDLANPTALKDVGMLQVDPPLEAHRLGAGLRQHLTRAAVETVATRKMTEADGRTLVLCRDTLPPIRNEVLFRLVELLNFGANLPPFTAMSDAPTASQLNAFDLVIAPRGVRADNSWVIVEAGLPAAPLPRVAKAEWVYQAIEESYAADTRATG